MSASTVLENPAAMATYTRPLQQRGTLRVPCFFSLAEQTLEKILERPYSLFLELDGNDRLASSIMRVLTDAPDFSLSLTTTSAYHGHIGALMADHMNKRFGLQSYKSMNIHTCLQEALINAIVHGNLSIAGQFSSLEKFDEHYAMISQRMEQDEFCRRRVTVSAWNSREQLKLCVRNEGSRFPESQAATYAESPCGRGLYLIRSLASDVWIGDDRLSLFMTFDY